MGERSDTRSKPAFMHSADSSFCGPFHRGPVLSKNRSMRTLTSQPAWQRFATWFSLFAIVACLVGCPSKSTEEVNSTSRDQVEISESQAAIRFVDRTPGSGLDRAFEDGQMAQIFSIVESLGGGISAIDFDNDGQLDLVAAGGGCYPTPKSIAGVNGALYRAGAWSDDSAWKFSEVAASGRVDLSEYYHHCILVADFNNDGFEDFLTPGFGGFLLHENLGDGTFHEIASRSGLIDSRWNTNGAWGDFNNDGNLDLYICRYADWSFENNPACVTPSGQRDVCGPRDFKALDDSLYLSDGTGKFVDATADWNLVSGGRGLGVLAADLDLDGDTDLYVANDEQPNFLFRNEDSNTLKEMGIRAGAGLDESGGPDGSMGIGVGDYDGDSQLDLFITHYESETCALYRNSGNLNFTHASRRANITSMGNSFVAWGTAFNDLDLDGDEDILVVNGHAVRHSSGSPIKQLPVLMTNQSDATFQSADAPGEFFNQPRNARGLVTADFDQDGRVDFVTTAMNEAPVLQQNLSKTKGAYLEIQLVGRTCNRNAIGATVAVFHNGESQIRSVYGGGSYASTWDRICHFGLKPGIDRVEIVVSWPGGDQKEIKAVDVNQKLLVVQPTS